MENEKRLKKQFSKITNVYIIDTRLLLLQCDLYYICENNVAKATLCPDGYLFDDTIRNREKCVLPHNVDCGKREFQQVTKNKKLHIFNV